MRRPIRSDSLVSPINLTSSASTLPQGTGGGDSNIPPLVSLNATHTPSQPLSVANVSYGFRFPANTPPVPSSLATGDSHPSQIVSSPLNGTTSAPLVGVSSIMGGSNTNQPVGYQPAAQSRGEYLGIHPNTTNPLPATTAGTVPKEKDTNNISFPNAGPRRSISLIRNMGMTSGGGGYGVGGSTAIGDRANGNVQETTNSIFSPTFELHGVSGRPQSGGFLRMGPNSDFGGDRPTSITGGIPAQHHPLQSQPTGFPSTGSAFNVYQTSNTLVSGNNNTIHSYHANIVIPNLVIGNFTGATNFNNYPHDMVAPNLLSQYQSYQPRAESQNHSANFGFPSEPLSTSHHPQQPTILHNVRITAEDLVDILAPVEILSALQNSPNTLCSPSVSFKTLVTNTLLGLAAATHLFLESRKQYNRHPTQEALDRFLIRTAVLDFVAEEILGNSPLMEKVEPSSSSGTTMHGVDKKRDSTAPTSLLTAMGWAADHHHIPRRSLTPSPGIMGGGVNRNPLLSPAALSAAPDVPPSLISPKSAKHLLEANGLSERSSPLHRQPTANVTTIPGVVPNVSGSTEHIDVLMAGVSGANITNVPKTGGVLPTLANTDPLADGTNPETTSNSAPALFGGTTSSAYVFAPSSPLAMSALAADWTSLWQEEKANQLGEEAITKIFQVSLAISRTFRLSGNLDRFEKDSLGKTGYSARGDFLGAGRSGSPISRRRRWSDSQNEDERVEMVVVGDGQHTSKDQSSLKKNIIEGIVEDIQYKVSRADRGRVFLYLLKAAISRIVILLLFLLSVGGLLGTVAIAIVNENAVKDVLDEVAAQKIDRKVSSMSIFGPAAVSLAVSLCQLFLMWTGASFTRLVPHVVKLALRAARSNINSSRCHEDEKNDNEERGVVRNKSMLQDLFHRISPFSKHHESNISARGGAISVRNFGNDSPDKEHEKRVRALMNVISASAERLCNGAATNDNQKLNSLNTPTSNNGPLLSSVDQLTNGVAGAASMLPQNDSFLRVPQQYLGVGGGVGGDIIPSALTSPHSPNTAAALSTHATEIPISNTAINEHLVIIGSDTNFRITLWNAAAERVTGYRSEEVMGQLITSIIDEKSMDGLKRILNHSNTTATRSVFMNSVRVLGKNENVVDLRATLTSSVMRNSRTAVAVCGTAHENFHRTNHAYVVRELNVQLQHDLTMLLHLINSEYRNAMLSPNPFYNGSNGGGGGVLHNCGAQHGSVSTFSRNIRSGSLGQRVPSIAIDNGAAEGTNNPLHVPGGAQSLSTPPAGSAGVLGDTANGMSLAGLLSVQTNAISPPTDSHSPAAQLDLEHPPSAKEDTTTVRGLQRSNSVATPALASDVYGANVVSGVYSSGRPGGAGNELSPPPSPLIKQNAPPSQEGPIIPPSKGPTTVSIPNSFTAGVSERNNNHSGNSSSAGNATNLLNTTKLSARGTPTGGGNSNGGELLDLVDIKLRQCLQLANLGTWANVSRISSRMTEWEQRSSDTLLTGVVRKYLSRLDLVFKNKSVMPEVFSVGASSVEAALITVFQATSGRIRCEVTYNPIALDSDGFIELSLTSLSNEDLSAAFGGCLMYANNASAALAGGLLTTAVPTIPGISAVSVNNPSTSPQYNTHNVGGGGGNNPNMSKGSPLFTTLNVAAPPPATSLGGWAVSPMYPSAALTQTDKVTSISNVVVGAASISAMPTNTFTVPASATPQQRSLAQTLQRHVVDVGGIVCTHDTQTLLTGQASPHTLRENRFAKSIFIRVPVRLTRTINKSGSMGSSLSFIGASGGGGSVISHNSNLNTTFAAVSEYCSVAVYEPNAFFRHSICDLVWSLGQAVMIVHSFEALQKTLRTPNIRVDCIVISVDDEIGLEMARFLLEPRGHTKDYFASVTASPLAVSAAVGAAAGGGNTSSPLVALADKYTVALTAEQLLTADRVAKVFDQRTMKNKNTRVHTMVKPFRRSHVSAMLRDAATRRNEAQLRQQQDEKNRKLFQLHRNAPWQRGELLGKGAFGNVYEGINTLTKGRMAVKEIYTEIMDKKKEIEFANEIAVMCELTHPNIVQYLYCEKGPKSILLFMELCEGGHLGNYIAKQENKRLSLAETVNFTRQLVSALAYLHSMNFAHRDIKPENVLLTSEGDQIKLTDFGTAARVLIGEKPFTETAGTIRYMAPEVFNGEPYGTACDVWSIGIMVLDMLGVSIPWLDGKDFFAVNEFYTTTIYDPRNPTPIPLPKDLPPDVKSFVSACLEVDQGSRALMSTLSHHPLLLNKVPDLYYVSGYDQRTAAANFDVPRAESPTGSNVDDDDDDELIHNFALGDHIPSEQVKLPQHNIFNAVQNNVSSSTNTIHSLNGAGGANGIHSLLGGTQGGSSNSGFGPQTARTIIGVGPGSYASLNNLPTVPSGPSSGAALPMLPTMGERLPQLPPFAQLPQVGGKPSILINSGGNYHQLTDPPSTSVVRQSNSYSPSPTAASASTVPNPQGLISSAFNSPLIPQGQARRPSSQRGLITLPPQVIVGGAPTATVGMGNSKHINQSTRSGGPSHPTRSIGNSLSNINVAGASPGGFPAGGNQNESMAESSGSDIVPFRASEGLHFGGNMVIASGLPAIKPTMATMMAESAPLRALQSASESSPTRSIPIRKKNESYASSNVAKTSNNQKGMMQSEDGVGKIPNYESSSPRQPKENYGIFAPQGSPYRMVPNTFTEKEERAFTVPEQLQFAPTNGKDNNNDDDDDSDGSEGMIPFH